MPHTRTFAQSYLQPYCIGTKLRALRTHKGLTLSRLAAETGLSTALLSKLETNSMFPTLPTLANICRVYGVGLSYFFCEPEPHTVSITRKAHIEAHGRLIDSLKAVPLTRPNSSSGLIAEMVEVPASGANALLSGENRETRGLVYVVEGSLQIEAGATDEVLDVGDCVVIESAMHIVWKANGKQRCRVITVRPVKRAATADIPK